MSERIDHAAEAVLCVKSSHRQREDGVAPEEAIRAGLDMLQAQVHATLALAEQQRIANLLTLTEHKIRDVNGDVVIRTVTASAIDMRREASILLGVNEDGSLS
jgi:hypothetical protein